MRPNSFISFPEVWSALRENARLFIGIVGTLLTACLLYCLISPDVYESSARVALKSAPESLLATDRAGLASASSASGPVQLETVANQLRSEQLAWNVIARLSLYSAPEFSRSFANKFPDFDPLHPSPNARDYLLDQFQRRLTVQSLPHTLVLEIRFRSLDAALSAQVVNALIFEYNKNEMDMRIAATKSSTGWLEEKLADLKTRIGRDDRQLDDFQKRHGIMGSPNGAADGRLQSFQDTTQTELDAISRELVSATADRILREAEYRAATQGDPELVVASDPKLQATGSFATSLLQQLHGRRSDLEQEQAQLRIEHGPNFPRILEIRSQIQNVDLQIKGEDAKLVERFHSAWKTAVEREQLVRKSLNDTTGAGLQLNQAELQYAAMRRKPMRAGRST